MSNTRSFPVGSNAEFVTIFSGRQARYEVRDYAGGVVFQHNDPAEIVARIRRNPCWRLSATQAADWNCDDLAEVRA